MPDLRTVFFVIGLMIAFLGLTMFIPMEVDLAFDGQSWRAFAVSGILTSLFGAALSLANYTPKPDLRARGAFLLTVTSWIALSAFGAIPFIMEPAGLSVTDAVFETVSGLTTTGSTILTGLDDMPEGVLLWRAMLQWIGGIGIIVTAMAVLPMLKVGGMQLLQLESSDVGDKILPRAASIAAGTFLIYLGLTLACAILYMVVGMSGFDAVAHAMTTLATGGYSTSDASMGGFMDKGADLVGIVFMICGGLPFGMFLLMARGDFKAPFKDSQVKTFIAVIISFSLMITFALWAGTEFGSAENESFWRALRLATFHTVSLLTTTGYATADYTLWGPFAIACFFCIMFIGGCAGSTSCAIKIFRFQIAFKGLRAYLFKMPRNHAVAPLKYGGRVLPETVVYSVLGYFFLFFVTYSVSAILLTLIGLDPLTAWSGAGSALTTAGPGIGEIIGPSGTYQSLPDPAKWVLMDTMIIGRLEIMTVLVVLSPGFWRT